jgi:type II secretory pathway predicted ATPase ExeA
MYLDFYGLKEKPFNLTPSPRFVYLSEGHKEALALLTYGVRERKGFILLTGEVGTGKTTMIHTLISNLDKSVEYVYLVNPILSPEEFIDYLAFSSFKKRVHFKSKADFLLEFENFLKTCLQDKKIFILIIDEAHKLSYELLEEIRLLSNMEFAEEKLINIFLVGQPELNDNLNSPKGRATLQRISIRYDIPPLGLKETGEYLETRLMVAGSLKNADLFQKDAVEAIHRHSQGYPRTINILADNALLLGYSRDKKTITASMIEETYNSMKLDGSFLKEQEQIKTTDDLEDLPPVPQKRTYKWALLSSSLIVLTAAIVFMIKISWISVPDLFKSSHSKKPDQITQSVSSVIKDKIGLEEQAGGTPKEIKSLDDTLTVEKASNKNKGNQISYEDKMESKKLTGLKIITFERDTGFSKSISAKQGDTLSDLARKVYGSAGEEELSLLKSHNPEITNLDQIEVGQKISFPVYAVLIEAYDSFEKADILCSQLKKDGYDANIISSESNNRIKSFEVAIGAFRNKKEAESFASGKLEGMSYNMPKK